VSQLFSKKNPRQKKNPSRGGEGFLGSKLSIRINKLKGLASSI
jgi:hypothetical protein